MTPPHDPGEMVVHAVDQGARDYLADVLEHVAPVVAANVPRQPLLAASPDGLHFVTRQLGPCAQAMWEFYSAVVHDPGSVTPQMWPTLAERMRAVVEAGDQLNPDFVDNYPPEQRQLPPG